MRILVIGSGAREHALAWKLASESAVREVICAPGNAGMARLTRSVAVDASDPAAVLALAERERIDLTVIGPEQSLERGVADVFHARGRLLLGPSRAAARLETSKVAAKEFMARHGVPTAGFVVCDTADAALDAIARGHLGLPIVVKADGLAAGKGVVVAPDRATAERAVHDAMVERRFGAAGERVVLEECLQGTEASFFVLADGETALPLQSAQDYKRAFDDDLGPNTGGMGAFAPSPLVTDTASRTVMTRIVEPVLAGLQQEGTPYRGFLYVGLMMTADGPQVIEFNVRFGDPEAQVVLPMLEDDLAPLLAAAAAGTMGGATCRLRPHPHVGVVLASGGYPGAYRVGKPVGGTEAAEDAGVLVFHAGTAIQDGRMVTSGGRVLTVVAGGADYAAAIARAYDGVSRISFEGMQYRKDIGRTALAYDAPRQ
jgi:phosphoribosylamine--glycine ligase